MEFFASFFVSVAGGVGAGLSRSVLAFVASWFVYAFGLLAAVRFRVGPEVFDTASAQELVMVGALCFAGAFVACCALYVANDEMEARWSPSLRKARAQGAARSPLRFTWGRSRFQPAAQAAGYTRAPRRRR